MANLKSIDVTDAFSDARAQHELAARGYTCTGSVRGCCGIEHRSLASAHECCMRDTDGCRSQGGYSDRYPERLDGLTLSEPEIELLDSLEAL